MPKAARTQPSLRFETDKIHGSAHWTPVWCQPHHFETLEKRLTKCPHGCPPGPSIRTLWSPAFEILSGGSRGGMKTETGRGFLIKGNFDESIIHPNGEHIMYGTGDDAYCGVCVNNSYIMHPRYRALVLRENEKDLADWIFRARGLYGPMGATVTEKPARVTWPSKATFVLGHMQDATSYTDYMGQEFQRMLFEELTQIPEELLYLRITMSCRSTFVCVRGCKPRKCLCGVLKPQVLATANPGGAGHLWVKKRLISIAPPNTIYVDPVTSLTRTYIPARVTDNPYLMRNEQYVNQLMGLPEPTRSAWLHGDWDALGGQYFRDFRPKGPLTGDPPEANHVIYTGSRALLPWCPKWIGGDWGYGHNFAFYWAYEDPNGQVILFDEITGSQTGSQELGVAIAKRSFSHLEAMDKAGVKPELVLWLSPDAFAKKDEGKSTAESIAAGIDSVLGPNAAFFPDTVLSTDGGWGWNQAGEIKRQAKFRISIQQAANARVLGWQYMRDLMRFRPLVEVDKTKFDQEYALQLLHQSVDLYATYLKAFEPRKAEVLPKLLIMDCCTRLIEAIPTAVYKEGTEDVLKTDKEEDDVLDAARYTLFSENRHRVREPQKSFVHNELERVKKMEPNMDYNSLCWASYEAEQKYKDGGVSLRPFSVPMESSRGYKPRRLQ